MRTLVWIPLCFFPLNINHKIDANYAETTDWMVSNFLVLESRSTDCKGLFRWNLILKQVWSWFKQEIAELKFIWSSKRIRPQKKSAAAEGKGCFKTFILPKLVPKQLDLVADCLVPDMFFSFWVSCCLGFLCSSQSVFLLFSEIPIEKVAQVAKL